jgi:hypothetical protein
VRLLGRTFFACYSKRLPGKTKPAGKRR